MDNYRSWHPNFPVNLDNCKDEPIHVPGAIQTFGVLLAYDPGSGAIRAISENAVEVFPDLGDFEKTDRHVESLVRVKEVDSFNVRAKSDRKRRLVFVQPVTGPRANQDLFGVIYGSGDLEVLEIETQKTTNAAAGSYLADLPSMMKDIQSQESLQDLVEFAADKIKHLTGFDRVMIYRYDEDWNGQVIAEAREDRLEAFLGLHYPASDIPAQARALYEKNWIRIIPTIHYRPAKLLPAGRQNLDLSNSVLRSVSPMHIRYLKNMGVGASMSISLMVGGKLWGLIACHHYADHLVPLDARLGCEAYGQLISWQIQKLTAERTLQAMSAGEHILHDVLARFGEADSFKTAALAAERQLLRLFDCGGMIIRLGDESVRLGKAPDDLFSNAVGKALIGRSILEPLVSKEAKSVPELAFLDSHEDCAGFMALSLAPKHNYYIICVRPEQVRTVNWAGQPSKPETPDFGDPAQRLVPRGSFALWKEIHRGRSLAWAPETIDIFKKFGLLFIKIVIERKEILEKSNHELKALSQAKDEFVAMVSHELRTPLNAIIGWTDLALSGDLRDEQLPDSLRIIQRNARSQNQLINDLLDISRIISGKLKLSVRSMRVSEIVEAVVLSYTPAAEAKMIKLLTSLDDKADSIIGDSDRIQQVIWNLLSNAVKFSPKQSTIWITVKRVNSHIELRVKDNGVGLEPENLEKIFGRFEQVDSSISRKAGGLGLGLAISKHIVELHGGRIEAHSEGMGKGTAFSVFLPIAPVVAEDNTSMPIPDAMHSRPPEYTTSSKRLAGEVILIVEDEPDALRFLNLLIQANGAKTYLARDGEEGLKVLHENKSEIGIVLSDVGMPGMDGHQMMTAIRQSPDKEVFSVCAVALTAFGRPQDRISCLKAGFDSYISKPVMQEELLAVLESACKAKKR